MNTLAQNGCQASDRGRPTYPPDAPLHSAFCSPVPFTVRSLRRSTQSVGSNHGLTSQIFVSLQLNSCSTLARILRRDSIGADIWQPHCAQAAAEMTNLRQSA